MKVAAIVLAAGASRRLGQPKQLLRLHGETLLRRTILAAKESGCSPVLTVLGAFHDQLRSEAESSGAIVLINDNWEEGIASSIRCGVQSLDDQTSAVVLLACDQPHLSAHHLRGLIERWQASHCDLVASEYAGTKGVPALFAQSLSPHLLNLQGDQGARALMQRSDLKIEAIPWSEGAFDVDVIEDAKVLREPPTLSAPD